MPHGFLEGDATRALEAAVAQIEARCAAEVVIAVRRQSAPWLHAHLIVGALAALGALAYMLFSPYAFSLPSILIDPFVIGAALGAATELWPGGKRLLTPRRRRRRVVERAARATFVERGVHQTRGRTGLLLYISVGEREAALVADTALEAAWPAAARDTVRDAIAFAIPAGGTAVARALAAACESLADAVPRRADDTNELPDALDAPKPRRSWRPWRS